MIYPRSRRGALSSVTAHPGPRSPLRARGAARPSSAGTRPRSGEGSVRGRAGWRLLPSPGVTSQLTASPPGLPPCGSRRRARRASGRHDGGAGVPRAAPSPGTRGRGRSVPSPGGHRARAPRPGIPRQPGGCSRCTPVRGGVEAGWAPPLPRSRARQAGCAGGGSRGALARQMPEQMPPLRLHRVPRSCFHDKQAKFLPLSLGHVRCRGSVVGFWHSKTACAKGRRCKATL